MTDILGQALQRITSPQTSIPDEQPPAVTLVAPSDLVAASNVALPEQGIIEEFPQNTSASTPELTTVISSAATRPNALEYLLSHRRQTTAVIVAVCVAVFWFDGVKSADSDAAEADAADGELMLDEFDAIEVSPLREPAEPSDIAAADPFPLTIPQMEVDAPQVQVSSRGSEHPLLNERIGDIRNQSAVQSESNGSPEFPAQPSSDNSPPANPRSVRFTGRIQPLN
ncbi:MAG: hypothetical protein NT138_05210 [Planctomycetales bacterium]|nr:hypothetical protein [Planctomycetales bacterium]